MNRRTFIGALTAAVAPAALRAANPKTEPLTIEIFAFPSDAEAFRVAAESYFKRPCTLTRARLDILTPAQLQNLYKPRA